MSDMTTIQVHEFPNCDLCNEPTPAPYDVKTVMGPWGNLCEDHFTTKGTKMGSKREIIKKKKPMKTIKDFDTVPPIAKVPLSMDSVVTVKCPWCGQKRRVETDANYLVTCEACEQPYRCRSEI
jgi:hypothetical protein